MSSRTNLRIAEVIRQRAAHVLLHEMKDPRMGFVTVTHVKLAPDFGSCVIYWSVIGTPGDRSKTKHALDDARLFVQRRVAEGLRTRTAPQLAFEFDESVEGAIKMGGLLKQLRDVRGDPVAAEDGDASAVSDADGEDSEPEPDAEDDESEPDAEDDEPEPDADGREGGAAPRR
ncbi:MAG: 30S ribosome-binding factor RbfA [Planctomycetes bacterium]|nr:30S ribosome-binding factor RbfA [Planctomycetota bacterium]